MNRSQALAMAILEARTRLGISQERLAELAKLHRNYIGKIEREISSPTVESLFAIADALNMSASVLIARAEELASLPGR